MYQHSLEFLDEERDLWRPFEALDDLTDEQLSRPVVAAHGWSGRDLIAHLVGWLEGAVQAARELAVEEASPTITRVDAELEARGADEINAEMLAEWGTLPIAEVRRRLRTVPGELRGYLTVVPERRWLKHPANLQWFLDEATNHYVDHRADLDAILAEAGSAR